MGYSYRQGEVRRSNRAITRPTIKITAMIAIIVIIFSLFCLGAEFFIVSVCWNQLFMHGMEVNLAQASRDFTFLY